MSLSAGEKLDLFNEFARDRDGCNLAPHLGVAIELNLN